MIITPKDGILIFEHQIDYLESEFVPLNDKIRLFWKKLDREYRERQNVLIVQLIEKDLVEKQLHVALNNKN